ncbi:Oidioi.mRNA.OKI2018_I69.chr1.g464.t1.cds [Oikopleura dioica]|uniref:Oidioi.mRNA.OKI2018_I69.chr1.g464.t1.cds n=1 Tax=Oikopleura dioica TaxID=34765 RepID=A0ABN7SJX6_OIKDI|nr:Oidioi.mRNA.OKI2018_I69.chr1.g464.t1.cds [Oikopleura dioica]
MADYPASESFLTDEPDDRFLNGSQLSLSGENMEAKVKEIEARLDRMKMDQMRAGQVPSEGYPSRPPPVRQMSNPNPRAADRIPDIF